ncbi:MAG: hypothetical protein Q7J27_07580 [Syntrophales bacterium]|nr:hypothetical protein [Syntrophales bacterium]
MFYPAWWLKEVGYENGPTSSGSIPAVIEVSGASRTNPGNNRPVVPVGSDRASRIFARIFPHRLHLIKKVTSQVIVLLAMTENLHRS